MNWKLGLGLRLVAFLSVSYTAGSRCNGGCDLALAFYYVQRGSNLSFIAQFMQSSFLQSKDFDTILSYNPQLPNEDNLLSDIRIKIPFPCDCIDGEFLAHVFRYSVVTGDTYRIIANDYYANLTTVPWLEWSNSYNPNTIPDTAVLNVTVNCSCGDSAVNKAYGLFLTYPLQPGETLDSVASANGVSSSLLKSFNVNVNFSQGNGLVYVPSRDASGSFRPLKSRTGLAGGVIAGISIAAVAVVLLLAVCIYLGYYQKRKVKRAVLQPSPSQDHSTQHNVIESTGAAESAGLSGITVDKSVEFSYEELAKATNDFNKANKIGEGGFGSVYYAELRGEKVAIKKMDMQASKEFLAELKVLTHVHHLNLVRLIGYCVESSLFLVYEYIENGNLSQHLRGSGRDPLPWSTRVQIALDSARALHYIHEHTVPVYIHGDIKPANILIDKNLRGKVADFGLSNLTEVGSASLHVHLVGTFGYMPPEYAQYGDVSLKVDVYAFGVVLYELISAKEAIVKGKDSAAANPRGLVDLFEEALNQPDPREDLRKLVDPRLGDNYPLESVRKMALLAKACTHDNPQLRPSMRSIVVALITLSSTTEEWDVGSFYENQALVGLMSGR